MKPNPNSKSRTGYIILAMLLFMFCTYSSLSADEAPIVDFNLNMPLGSCQELKVLNAREGMTYTFELVSGQGTLSGSTYCAPATAAGPEDKPVIRVTAVSGAQALSSSQALASRAHKILTKTGAAAASSGTSTDIGIGIYSPACASSGSIYIRQYCTEDYPYYCHPDNPGSCCFEDVRYKCDGSFVLKAMMNNCCAYPPNPHSCDMCSDFAKNVGTHTNCISSCFPIMDNNNQPSDAQPLSCDYVGNPVSILDGAKKETAEDITLGNTLVFARYYNSLLGESSTVLGQRWSHNFNLSLSFFNSLSFNLKIKEPDGRGLYFKIVSGTSNYIGLYTETATVTADTTGYTWFRTDGSQYRFNLSGRLTGITEASGTTKTLAYDASNRLSTITDNTSNRTLTLTYNSNNRITQITGPITATVPDGIYVKYQYDSSGRLTNVIYPDNTGFLYLYANTTFPNHLTEKRDRSGRVLAQWTYDSKGRAITDKTLDGRSYTITYGQGMQANEVTVADAYGQSKKYILTRNGGLKRLFETTNQNGCSSCGSDAVKYSYDANYNIIQKKYANGRVDQYFDFDSRGNPATLVEAYNSPEQRTIQRTYHPRLNRPLTETVLSILTTGSKQTIYDYDNDANTLPNENPSNLVYRQIEKGFTKDQTGAVVPYEFITSFTYNANGQVLTIDGPKAGTADQITYAYYANGDLQSITQPLVGTTTYTQYDTAGLVGRVTDSNGLAVTMTYDARGRIKTRTTEANNAVITYNYNATGDIASVTDAMGVTLTYTYETTYGRLDKITDPTGNYLKYSYDDKGNRIEQGYYTPSNSRTYQMRYNYQHPTQPGKLWKVINPDNTFTEYSYDNTGNIASIKNPNNKITTYQYDLFNRIKNVIQPGSILTAYTYDGQDHLITVTDAKNNTTTYAYDDLGRVLSVTSPDTNTMTYVYDEANNLISMIDSKNQETRFTYDLLNRVLTKQHFLNGLPSSVVGPSSYTYDQGPNAKDRLTQVIDPSSSQAYEYDELGRLELETKTINGISFQILYGYNKNNELETMTYPSGRVVSYNKNAAGQIDEVSTSYENNLTPLVQNITRLPFGPITGLNLSNGLDQVQTFDQLYRLTSSQTGSIYNRSYTYNPNNNITHIQDLVTPAKNQTFDYDDLNRLTDAAGAYGNIAYTYDSVGNRLSLTKGIQSEAYTYQTNTNRLTRIDSFENGLPSSVNGPFSYTYDTNGNITGLGPKSLNYTPDNRLLEVQPVTPVVDNLKSEYVYNSQGQRIQKKVYKFIAGDWQLMTVDLFIYDAQGNLILEADGSGNVLKEYAYLEGNRIAQFSHDLPTQTAIEVVTNGNHLLANVRVYAFTAEGHYTGIYAVTDAEGRAAFELKDLQPGQYKFRADYLSGQFWTPELAIPSTVHYQLVIAEEMATVTVAVAGAPRAGVKVYLFNDQGTYLGLYQVTDDQGQVSFDLPVGYTFKFRADTLASQYWSPATPIIAGTNNIALVNAGGGILNLTLEKDPSHPLPGLKTYIFNMAGTYLGLNAISDANGQAAFSLSQGQYKIRIDYLGYQLWSDPINVNQNTSQVLTIPHQDVGIQVSGDYDNTPVPKPGLKAYLFNPANTYLSLSQNTDSQGQVTFNLPQQDYKVRVDYLGQQYWTNAFNWQNRTIIIPEGQAQVTVTRLDQPLKDIKVYAFNAQGTYLGLTQTSDDQGQASFKLPEGQYKFRADYLGNQYWSDLSTILSHTINPIALSTGGGHFMLLVNKDENMALPGLKCYLFNTSGTYLGQQANTNDQGQVSFNPSNGDYKIRVDYLGYQYWTDVFTIPSNTELTLTIPHQDLSVQVESKYLSRIEPLAGVKTYLFLPNNTYQGLSPTTDAAGKAFFNLPQQDYKVRVDYLGQQYWSADFNWTDPIVTIPEGLAEVHLSQQGAPIPNASVYLFSGAGAYLGITAKTDSLGLLSFQVPAGTYKFRADYQGNQYWATAEIQPDQVNIINLNTGGGTFTLNVLKGENQPLANIPVYAFTSSGSYLNLNSQTNAQGQVVFNLSNGQYKFRVDYLGYQFWSNVEIVPDNLSDILLIPHQQVTLTVNENYQQDKEPLQNVSVYLFKASGSYLSIYAHTNDQGQVSFEVPQQAYKVRADYMGYPFWSEPFVGQNREVDIEHGECLVHVTQGGQNIANAKVYLFKPTGTYLSQYQTTDPNGLARFLLPNQAYKFRVDYNGKQYWTGEVTMIAHEENGLEVDIDQLTLDETNNPNPTRFDGFPPLYRTEAVKMATAGSLVGLLAQTQTNLGDSDPGIVYYYVNDHLGTPQLMADHEGQVVWRADYDPFGAAAVDPGSNAVNQHRFPGQYADETQLHYNYHRYYDPRSGRYITADPIGIKGGLNLFVYVRNNPINRIDLLGTGPTPADIKKWTDEFKKYKGLVDACKGDMDDPDQCSNCCKAIAHKFPYCQNDPSAWWGPWRDCYNTMCLPKVPQ